MQTWTTLIEKSYKLAPGIVGLFSLSTQVTFIPRAPIVRSTSWLGRWTDLHTEDRDGKQIWHIILTNYLIWFFQLHALYPTDLTSQNHAMWYCCDIFCVRAEDWTEFILSCSPEEPQAWWTPMGMTMLREPIRWGLNSNPVQPTVSQNQKKLKPTQSKTKVAWGCFPMPHQQSSTTNKDQSSMGVSPCYSNSKQLKSKQNKTKWMGCKMNVKQDGGHGCESELKEHEWMWNRTRNKLMDKQTHNSQVTEPSTKWTNCKLNRQTNWRTNWSRRPG